MQATTLLAHHRTANNQLGNLYQITQLQQIIRHAEVGVIFVYFLLQHIDTPQGALKTFCCAHNADVIPHKQP
ncbi:Uncharacterised protein [Shigella sonnei]|nr:Uncharacterised protein [Shigella sonnei]